MPTEFDALVVRARLTTAQTAALCGVNPRTVRRWRSGRFSPRKSAVILLSVIIEHGLHMVARQPAALEFLLSMIEAMKNDGLSQIQRKTGIGYGVIARTLERIG